MDCKQCRENLKKSFLGRKIAGHASPESTVQRWVSHTRCGRTDLKNCFEESCHWSLRSLASNVQLPYGTIERIVRDELRMIKKFRKWVPLELTPDQKHNSVLRSEMNYWKTKFLLGRTLTVDESWVGLNMAPD
jgi:hypothetical protein